jgi:hypothetical protein
MQADWSSTGSYHEAPGECSFAVPVRRLRDEENGLQLPSAQMSAPDSPRPKKNKVCAFFTHPHGGNWCI